jgi:hypothetical protein
MAISAKTKGAIYAALIACLGSALLPVSAQTVSELEKEYGLQRGVTSQPQPQPPTPPTTPNPTGPYPPSWNPFNPGFYQNWPWQ